MLLVVQQMLVEMSESLPYACWSWPCGIVHCQTLTTLLAVEIQLQVWTYHMMLCLQSCEMRVGVVSQVLVGAVLSGQVGYCWHVAGCTVAVVAVAVVAPTVVVFVVAAAVVPLELAVLVAAAHGAAVLAVSVAAQTHGCDRTSDQMLRQLMLMT